MKIRFLIFLLLSQCCPSNFEPTSDDRDTYIDVGLTDSNGKVVVDVPVYVETVFSGDTIPTQRSLVRSDVTGKIVVRLRQANIGGTDPNRPPQHNMINKVTVYADGFETKTIGYQDYARSTYTPESIKQSSRRPFYSEFSPECRPQKSGFIFNLFESTVYASSCYYNKENITFAAREKISVTLMQTLQLVKKGLVQTSCLDDAQITEASKKNRSESFLVKMKPLADKTAICFSYELTENEYFLPKPDNCNQIAEIVYQPASVDKTKFEKIMVILAGTFPAKIRNLPTY